MKKYVCPVCGYVHEGNEPPEKCPQCGVPGSKFTVMEEGTALNFVCEHVIGVGAKDQVEADVYEGLKANFEGYRSWYVYRNEQTGNPRGLP